MIVAIAWPIVFLREADFALWILPLQRVSNTSIGMSPWEVGQNVAYFAVGHTLRHPVHRRAVSLVCRRPGAVPARCAHVDVDRGRRRVDCRRLSGLRRSEFSQYRVLGLHDSRLGDAGGSEQARIGRGVLDDRRGRAGAAAAAALADERWRSSRSCLAWPPSWLSGSRTGLAAVGVSLDVRAHRSHPQLARRRGRALDLRRVAMAGAGAIVLAVAMVIVLQNASTHTIVARGTLGYLPFIGDRGIVKSANELLVGAIWLRTRGDPDDRGTSDRGCRCRHVPRAVARLRQAARLHDLAPDNAQNWFRHIFAELGIARRLSDALVVRRPR